MKAVYGERAVPYMRNQMKGWLDLSQRGLPSSLLLLSRALVGGAAAAPVGLEWFGLVWFGLV
jgi:LETM1 and EF-hand domain-containing protein 1